MCYGPTLSPCFHHWCTFQYDHRPLDQKLRSHRVSNVELEGENAPKPDKSKERELAAKSPNLQGFNETAYILGDMRDRADAYKYNAFNQEESDKVASDRSVPDTRHYSWVTLLHLCCTLPMYRQFVCLFVCLSVVCLSVCLSVYLSVFCLSVCLSFCLHVCNFIFVVTPPPPLKAPM